MRNKNQGEGDYEAARRFNRQQREFVERKLGKHKVAADFTTEHSDDSADEDARDAIDHEVTERDDDEYLRRQGIEVPRSRN